MANKLLAQPTRNNIPSYLESLSWNLDFYTSKFENILMIGDLNISMENNNMRHFCESYNLKSLIKVPTCSKNPESPSCIDLILTNKPRNFQNSCDIETSLLDFHKNDEYCLKGKVMQTEKALINDRLRVSKVS